MEFNFAENGTVDKLDTVPQKYQGLYAEVTDEGDNKGKFTLIDAAKGIVADYVGTATTLAGVRKDKKAVGDENAQRRLATKAFEDMASELGLEIGDEGVAPALKTFITELQASVKGGKDLNINLDKIKVEWEKKLADLAAAKDGEISEITGALTKHLVSDAATRALSAEKGSIDLLLPHVVSQCTVVRDENGSYSVRVKDAQGDDRMGSDGNWMTVEGAVKEMKTKDAFGRAFESEQAPGHGTKPGSMDRPTRATQPQNGRELTPNEKIAAGLKKGQYRGGAGTVGK